jgi:hypothetical protein
MALQNLVHHNRLSIFRCIFMLNGPHNRFFSLSPLHREDQMPGLFPLHLPCAFIRPPGKALQLVREGMQPAGEGQGGCRQERASGPRSLGECCAQQIVRVGKKDGRAWKEEQRTGREKDLFFCARKGKGSWMASDGTRLFLQAEILGWRIRKISLADEETVRGGFHP